MTVEIRLTHDDARAFAAASRDTAPLHLDPAFARRTPFGACVAHGALAVVAALGALAPEDARRVAGVRARFARPVFLEAPYAVSTSVESESHRRVWVEGHGLPALDADVELAVVPIDCAPRAVAGEAEATAVAAGEVERLDVGVDVGSGYAPDARALRTLADQLGASAVPPPVLEWLALCSWIVGVRLGPDALLVQFEVAADGAADGDPPAILDVDRRIDAIRVGGVHRSGACAARVAVTAFRRRRAPIATAQSLRLRVGSGRDLTDEQVVVVGGTRGIGAAVAGALAHHGAAVWALGRSAPRDAPCDPTSFAVGCVEYVAVDASDPGAAAAALARVPGATGAVFCAAPPLNEIGLAPRTVTEVGRFAGRSIALVLAPLAVLLQRAEPLRWLVFFSSPALERPPRTWLHYAVAKSGVEAIAAHCREHSGADVLVMRPAKTWTELVNGPGAWVDALAAEDVAAEVVEWVRARV